MSFEIPNTEPHKLIAGNSWQWDKTLASYPASDGWELSYQFRGETDYAAVFGSEVTSPSGEDGFEIRIVPANTTLTPGPYILWGTVTDGTDVFTPVELKLNVLANNFIVLTLFVSRPIIINQVATCYRNSVIR